MSRQRELFFEKLCLVRRCITDFQAEVHAAVVGCIGLPSYVLDLATMPAAAGGFATRLVEVNPFSTSGAALFSWRSDRSLLHAGRADGEVEMRVVSEVLGRP